MADAPAVEEVAPEAAPAPTPAPPPKPRGPDVSLGWNDFRWGLEELRNTDYTSVQTRDWFRLNPVEIVLLGCEAVAEDTPVERKITVLLLRMECIRTQLWKSARLWSDTFIQLSRLVAQEPPVPPNLLAHIVDTLIHLYTATTSTAAASDALPSLVAWTRLHVIRHVLPAFRKRLGHIVVHDGAGGTQGKMQAFVDSFNTDMQHWSTLSTSIRNNRLSKGKPTAHAELVDILPIIEGIITDQKCGSFEADMLVATICTLRETAKLGDLHGLQTFAAVSHKFNLADWAQTIGATCASPGDTMSELLLVVDSLIRQPLSKTAKSMPLFTPRGTPIPQVPVTKLQKRKRQLQLETDEIPDAPTADIVPVAPQEVEEVEPVAGPSAPIHVPRRRDENVLIEGPDNIPDEIIPEAEHPPHEGTPPEVHMEIGSPTRAPLSVTVVQEDLEIRVDGVTLLVDVHALVKRWKQKDGVYTSTTAQLLALVRQILWARKFVVDQLEAVIDDICPRLMTYGTEGYLGSDPESLYSGLLSFLSRALETGLTPAEFISNHLPNLLGPVFGLGTASNAVAPRLLEYGTLALSSRHYVQLLGSGLHALAAAVRAYPTVDLSRVMHHASQVASPVSKRKEEDPSDAAVAGLEGDEDFDIEAQERMFALIAARANDKEQRAELLEKLLNLGCVLIRARNVDLTYLFAAVLPGIFKGIEWETDARPLYIRMLNFGTTAVRAGSAWFLVFGACFPRLVQAVQALPIDAHAKMEVASKVIDVLTQTHEKGKDVQQLLSFGLELLYRLAGGPEGSAELFEKLLISMSKNFVTDTANPLLLLLRTAVDFFGELPPLRGSTEEGAAAAAPVQEEATTTTALATFFPTGKGVLDADKRKLFVELVLKGKRQDVRAVYGLCRKSFAKPMYAELRKILMHYTRHDKTAMTSQTLEAISQLYGTFERLEVSDEQEAAMGCIRVMSEPLMAELNDLLHADKLTPEAVASLQDRLQRVALFKTVHEGRLEALTAQPPEAVREAFRAAFPVEVTSSPAAMAHLNTIATRLDHTDLTRYKDLKVAGQAAVAVFLDANATKEETPVGQEAALAKRYRTLDNYVDSLPRNAAEREALIAQGYSPLLWSHDRSIWLEVTTDGARGSEDQFKTALVGCYGEYVDLLRQLGLTKVQVGQTEIEASELFVTSVSIEELRGRRAAACRLIDKWVKDGIANVHVYDRKLALLANEEKLEADLEASLAEPIKPRTFKVVWHKHFFDCVASTGAHIVGCYAPAGDHCEKPYACGLAANLGILSVYDVEANLEIENVEVRMYDQGAYIYKVYSNGHPYETYGVWIAAIRSLVMSGLFPAVILPANFPTQRTFETISEVAPVELTNILLTKRDDLFDNVTLYFDDKTILGKTVRGAQDIYLTPARAAEIRLPFSPGATGAAIKSTSEDALQVNARATKIERGLDGFLFDKVMASILATPSVAFLGFLGRNIAAYVTETVEHGNGDAEALAGKFDYDRWLQATTKKSKPAKKKNAKVAAAAEGTETVVAAEPAPEPTPEPAPRTKDEIMHDLVMTIKACIWYWVLVDSDLADLHTNHLNLLLEVRKLLMVASKINGNTEGFTHDAVVARLGDLDALLRRTVTIVPLAAMSRAPRENLMRWVFRNEDRVWRHRGGRDRGETLQQYLAFVNEEPNELCTQYGMPKFGGIMLFADGDESARQSNRVVGYAVGEYVREGTGLAYEVVTAWVDNRYRNLGLAVKLYCEVCARIDPRAGWLVCDVLKGSLDRIADSYPPFRAIRVLGLLPHIVRLRQNSYEVDLDEEDEDGHRPGPSTKPAGMEQWEKLVINARLLARATQLYTLHESACQRVPLIARLESLIADLGLRVVVGLYNRLVPNWVRNLGARGYRLGVAVTVAVLEWWHARRSGAPIVIEERPKTE